MRQTLPLPNTTISFDSSPSGSRHSYPLLNRTLPQPHHPPAASPSTLYTFSSSHIHPPNSSNSSPSGCRPSPGTLVAISYLLPPLQAIYIPIVGMRGPSDTSILLCQLHGTSCDAGQQSGLEGLTQMIWPVAVISATAGLRWGSTIFCNSCR